MSAATPADRGRLRELWRLLIARLIDALNEPSCKASMLNVARQFLKDQGSLDDDEVPQAPSRVAAALARLLDDDELPFNAPEDD